MLNPLVGTDVLEPPRISPLADDPVEVAVLVDIDERGLTHLVAHLRDLVILEPGHGCLRRTDGHGRDDQKYHGLYEMRGHVCSLPRRR